MGRSKRLVACEQVGEMLVHRSWPARSNGSGTLKFWPAVDEARDRIFERFLAARRIGRAGTLDQLIDRGTAIGDYEGNPLARASAATRQKVSDSQP